MRELGTSAASPLWSGARGTPPHSTVCPRLLPEVKLPPLTLLPRGSGEGRRPDGSWHQRGGKPQRSGGQQAGSPGSPSGGVWRTGVGGEVRGARDLPYSGLGPVHPQFWPRGTDPAGQLPHPFSRTPRRHGGSLGLACAPLGVGVSLSLQRLTKERGRERRFCTPWKGTTRCSLRQCVQID